jgi:hypothetical protein
MNSPSINSQTLVKYLLGSLPEKEAERLDELYITDGEFAAALSAAEKDLVDAYVQGELTGPELERFRVYYLSSPLRRNRLGFAQALSAVAEVPRTAASSTALEQPAELSTKQEKAKWFTGKSFFTTPRLGWQWGFAAAAIALFVVGSWLVFENMRLRQQASKVQTRPELAATREQELENELGRQREAIAKTEQELARVREEREALAAKVNQTPETGPVREGNTSNKPPPATRGASIASFILTPQLRGVQQVRTISIPADTNQVSMRLELEPNDASDYRVALIDQAGQLLWRSRQLKATSTTSGKSLDVMFPTRLLRSQAYTLRVTNAAGDPSDVISDYPFKVVKQ